MLIVGHADPTIPDSQGMTIAHRMVMNYEKYKDDFDDIMALLPDDIVNQKDNDEIGPNDWSHTE